MAIRTLWVCSRAAATGAAFLALLPLSLGCREPRKPSLDAVVNERGSAPERAHAFVRVALQGRSSEQRRAAFLWGLYACEADAPRAAVTAFRLAHPTGGRSALAVRRLLGAVERNNDGPGIWIAAADSRWMAARERADFLLRGGEARLAASDIEGARLCARSAAALRDVDRGRLLSILARTGERAAVDELALDFPSLFDGRPGLPPLSSVTASFTAGQWKRHASGWLAVGNAQRALNAARRAGKVAALEAAKAAIRLRRPQEALQWARQSSEQDAARWLVEAEAYRQSAWSTSGADRERHFAATTRAAERALRLARDSAERGAAGLLAAEGLSESGRYLEAATFLSQEATREQARFEWVWRRCIFLQGAGPKAEKSREFGELGRTTRGRRLAAFWRGAGTTKVRDEGALRELASSGYVDLPAQWAARRLGSTVTPIGLLDAAPTSIPPPRWAADLLSVGRLADVLLGWRAELESQKAPSAGWLSFASRADLPPLEAIPLLVRGEPRLLSGHWGGLPRQLLEAYLPLLWRPELERAAARAGVPPWLLAALVRQESAWYPRAVSAAGAVGLTQVLPTTAQELMRQRRDVFAGNDSVTDPATNLAVGAMLLSQWQRAFSGSWVAGLAAYNAGERRVRAVWEQARRRDGPEFVEALEIPETWDYVHRVVMLAEGYRSLYWPDGRGYPWT